MHRSQSGDIRSERLVRPNCSAELLLCGSAQMTEFFSAEHRTFFSATFHIFVLLNDSHVHLGKIAKKML